VGEAWFCEEKLDAADFSRIMKYYECSLAPAILEAALRRLRALRFSFEDEACATVGSCCQGKKPGARGLLTVFEKKLFGD